MSKEQRLITKQCFMNIGAGAIAAGAAVCLLCGEYYEISHGEQPRVHVHGQHTVTFITSVITGTMGATLGAATMTAEGIVK